MKKCDTKNAVYGKKEEKKTEPKLGFSVSN